LNTVNPINRPNIKGTAFVGVEKALLRQVNTFDVIINPLD